MKSTWSMPAPQVGDPTPPLFHLLALGVGVGGNTNFSKFHANLSVFRYQHVGIPNTKLCLGAKPNRQGRIQDFGKGGGGRGNC